MDKTVLYESVEPMLRRLAWTYHSRQKDDLEECQAIANLGFARAAANYDPLRGAFTTWCYCQAEGLLKSYRTGEAERYAGEKQVEDVRLDRNPSRSHCSPVDAAWSDLSDDARLVIRAVLDSPAELFGLAFPGRKSPGILRRKLWQHLRNLGWSLGRAATTFDEIGEVLA